MSTSYRPAPAVQRIAEDLIPHHHDHLIGVLIVFVFREKASKRKGRELLGSARKIGGLNAYLAQVEPDETYSDDDLSFFVVEISEEHWPHLNDDQRVALVDHELCHLAVDVDDETGERTLRLRGHDLEEFREVVERHGLWQPDVEEFARSCQPSLLESLGGGLMAELLAAA